MEKKITIASKLLLLLIFIFGVCSGSSLAAKSDVSYADEKQLTLNAENITIQQAIQKIQDQSEFDFFYKNVDLEKTQKKVSFAFEGKTIHEVLPELLAGTNLAYKVMEKDIVIFPSSSETVKEDESSVQEAGQQQIEVSGTVTDAQTDEPLPGVNIVVQGTTTGTTTNMDGEYTIEAPADATLVFSFVGYQEQTVEIDGREEINIAMEQATTELEEVVAIGYGTARKEDLTGSITSADPSVTQEMPNTNVLQSLHGNLAGLDIGATDAAGESPSIKVRGYSTLSTSASANQPLIVVDGSIYRGNISDLNTADIESIDVLKGVSATAVYGSQASNGVMIISTKEGTDEVTEKPILSYSAKYSYKTPNEHALEPMSADEHREFIRDVHWQDGYLSPDYTEEDPEFDPKDHLRSGDVAEGFEAGIDPGWYDNFTSDGYLNNHNLSIRGKSEKLSYFASAGYTDEQGYHYNDQYSKYNFRINLDFEINDWMSIGLKSFLANSDYSGYEINLFTMMPYSPIYESPGDPDSGYRLETGHNQLNPYLSKQRDDSDKRLNLRANPTLDIDFPFIQGLTYRVSYTNNYRDRKHYHFNEYGSTGYVGNGWKNYDVHNKWSLDNRINYNRNFDDIHAIDFTLLYGVEKLVDEYSNTYAEDFASGKLGYNKLELGNPDLHSINTGKSSETSLYQMARLNYNYMRKYYLTGTLRRDGYSGFGAEKKIGYFPSGALGWAISREPFFDEDNGLFNYLKLRASYGSSGRRAVGRYQTKASVNRYTAYVYGDGGSQAMGQEITSMANPELGWEKTTGVNVGVDFRLLNERLRGNIEYYNNNTSNILYNIQLPNATGFSSIPKNISEVHNYGIEFSLTGDVIQSGNFNWEATVNFTRDRNEISKILGRGSQPADELFIGEPQRVIYDYKVTGMWQIEDEQAGEIPDGFYPGTYKIADLNDDGQFSASDDREIRGYRDPSYRFNISNRVNYKGFSLYMNIHSIQGGEDYYYADESPMNSGSWYKRDQLEYQNVKEGAWDYWLPSNPDARYRRLDMGSAYAGMDYEIRPYMQRNFIRLQDVSLSYTFENEFVKKMSLRSLKVYLSGKNLITLTDWPGWDPETGYGIVHNGRPMMRNFTIGVDVEF